MPPREHRVILGPPGSGKTQILIHRADYLSSTYRLKPDQYRVFVFTAKKNGHLTLQYTYDFNQKSAEMPQSQDSEDEFSLL